MYDVRMYGTKTNGNSKKPIQNDYNTNFNVILYVFKITLDTDSFSVLMQSLPLMHHQT